MPHTHEEHVEIIKEVAKASKPTLRRVEFVPEKVSEKWLDASNEAQKKFIDVYGTSLARELNKEFVANYYVCNWELLFALYKAANELHHACIAATERVLGDDELLATFGIPKVFWGKIRKSWETQKAIISGRFDFAFNGSAIKMYEYNADSAATMLEYAVIQQQYLEAIGLKEYGFSAGSRMVMSLKAAWVHTKLTGLVHFLTDDDVEEEYTALIVMESARSAGLETKLVKGLKSLRWLDGRVVDSEGIPLKQIWKTWSWETAIDDYNAVQKERGDKPFVPVNGTGPRLSDVLFQDDILVFEPLWKAIPSNKAILPVLWEMYPEHPNLLRSEWELSEELKKTGYAAKPIVGRTGQNITLHDNTGSAFATSTGKFSSKEIVYQELFTLPEFDGYHGIIGGWILGDVCSGFGIREDKSAITNMDSPCSAVLIANDDSAPPESDEEFWVSFGVELGTSPEGIPSYSSDYKTAAEDGDFNSFLTVDGKTVFCGAKWQCVEYSRRYLILTRGVTFASIPMAWNIYKTLPCFTRVSDGSEVKITKFENGTTKQKPVVGSLLIWGEATRHTGHVAVITDVSDDNVYISEQNWTHVPWADGCHYARKLALRHREDGSYYIYDEEEDHIIGWVAMA